MSYTVLRKIQESLEAAHDRERNRSRGYSAEAVNQFYNQATAMKWLAGVREGEQKILHEDLQARYLTALKSFIISTRRRAEEAWKFGQTEAWMRLSDDALEVAVSLPELTESEQEMLNRMEVG